MENQNLSIFMAVCDGHNDTILVYCNYSSLAQTPAEYNMNFSPGSVQTQVERINGGYSEIKKTKQ
jgi:hypothetical protein